MEDDYGVLEIDEPTEDGSDTSFIDVGNSLLASSAFRPFASSSASSSTSNFGFGLQSFASDGQTPSSAFPVNVQDGVTGLLTVDSSSSGSRPAPDGDTHYERYSSTHSHLASSDSSSYTFEYAQSATPVSLPPVQIAASADVFGLESTSRPQTMTTDADGNEDEYSDRIATGSGSIASSPSAGDMHANARSSLLRRGNAATLLGEGARVDQGADNLVLVPAAAEWLVEAARALRAPSGSLHPAEESADESVAAAAHAAQATVLSSGHVSGTRAAASVAEEEAFAALLVAHALQQSGNSTQQKVTQQQDSACSLTAAAVEVCERASRLLVRQDESRARSAMLKAGLNETSSAHLDDLRAERDTWLLLNHLHAHLHANNLSVEQAAQGEQEHDDDDDEFLRYASNSTPPRNTEHADDAMLDVDETPISNAHGRDVNSSRILLDRFHSLSHKQVVEKVVSDTPVLQLCLVATAWLEAIAEERVDQMVQDVQWKNTLHAIVTDSDSLSKYSLVTELDPDAPLREGPQQKLHTEDVRDEELLLRSIWLLVRAGKLPAAVDLCRRCHQYWRACSLQGNTLSHDPVLVGEGIQLEGNPTRDLWRTACFNLSEHSPSKYERAVYGSLCGNLRQVLPVCGARFHDHLWAYLTTYIVSRIHSLLAIHPHPDVSSTALEGGLLMDENELGQLRQGDTTMTPWQILTHLTEGGAAPEVVQDGSRPYHLIQAMLLSGCGFELVDRLRQWAEEDHQTEASAEAMMQTPPPGSKRMTPRLLRLAVHIGLFLYEHHSPVPVPSKSAAANRMEDRRRIEEPLSVLLLCYIRHLVHNNQLGLVAVYTSKLPVELRIPTHAAFLERITDSEKRRQCLLLAERAGLDIHAITKRITSLAVHSTDHTTIPSRSASLNQSISAADEQKIQAVEWLCFDPAQRMDALLQSNSLARSLLADAKVEAVRKLLVDVLPTDTIPLVRQRWTATNQPAEELNAVREHHALRDYLDAQRTVEVWNRHHHACPAPPEPPAPDALTSDQVRFERRMNWYRNAHAEWSEQDRVLSTEAVQAVERVLVFPGGWLCDQVELEDEQYASRRDQLVFLRRKCVPELVFLLHRVLLLSSQSAESLSVVANLVADEAYGLYQLFDPSSLYKLMSLLRESAITTLDRTQDPLGFY